jgi:Zn-dependent peptidase ImmA (M78 family)
VINKLLIKEVDRLASNFRTENGYGVNEPIHLTSLFLRKNIITIFRPLSSKFAGMAIKANDDLRFMMVNQNHSLGKQHFTIGHELYHLFIQEEFSSQRCITALFDKQTDIEEQKADIFAACLLLPETGITELIPISERQKRNMISAETVFKIQQYYTLSINAVIYRLVELDFVDKIYFDKYSSDKKNTARKLGYDISLYEPGNEFKVIGDYGLLVNHLYKNKKISESYYLELLNAINIDPFELTENGNE